MKPVQASAPGKAVLIGEYAVLEDAPAVAMAIDRRARVTLAPVAGSRHGCVCANSGARASFRAEPSGLAWVDGPAAEFTLLGHVWRAVAPAPGGSIELGLDTRCLFDPATGAKLGLGSSAALSVALAAALAGEAAPQRVQDAALLAHRAFQDGHGSGVDVATSVHGGVIRYRRDGARVRTLSWPAGLEVAFLWSGRAADTASRLARLARATDRQAALRALAAAAEDACGEWEHGADAALAGLAAWCGALARFDRAVELGIFAAGHEALHAEAARRGIVYKPCGAGGGDAGAAFGRDPEALAAFTAWAAARGFGRIAAALDARGVALESP